MAIDAAIQEHQPIDRRCVPFANIIARFSRRPIRRSIQLIDLRLTLRHSIVEKAAVRSGRRVDGRFLLPLSHSDGRSVELLPSGRALKRESRSKSRPSARRPILTAAFSRVSPPEAKPEADRLDRPSSQPSCESCSDLDKKNASTADRLGSSCLASTSGTP